MERSLDAAQEKIPVLNRLSQEEVENWDVEKIFQKMILEQDINKKDAEKMRESLSSLLKKGKLSDISPVTIMDRLNQVRKEGSSKPVLKLSSNAITVLERRYLRKDAQGKIAERPLELFMRVARSIAQPDIRYGATTKDLKRTYQAFLDIMTNRYFMPNSPTLMNAGRELGQLSACFVLPVGDSMEDIFDSLKYAAIIHKSGGGTGFSFSRLRPLNDVVNSTQGVSSGPVSFMTVFDGATEAVKQGGTRRGANMGILQVDHPDILQFIDCKQDTSKITNFNISVTITDQFVDALRKNGEYDLINPRNNEVVSRLKAKKVFDKIIKNAWTTGEPGVIFIDRINDTDPLVPVIGKVESTNPCGEQPLHPFDSCNLGSINLSLMVDDDGGLNWERLRNTVRTSVHFLDNVIDANKYPLPQIAEMTRANRKIGLGVMGWADLLIKLEIPYNSEEAIETAEQVMSFIKKSADEMSEELAEIRGAFANFSGSRHDLANRKKLRNATCTTLAPTGTISIISGCSSGIEPLFAISFIRNVMDNDELLEVNPHFERIARRENFYSEELMRKIAKCGTIAELDEIPEKWRAVFKTAFDISPEWHIRMQAAFQKYTDNAVSKTVNFPQEATEEDIAKVFLMADELGCKGVTVYRDGSRDAQVLNIGKVNRETEGAEKVLDETVEKKSPNKPRERPEVVLGTTQRMTTGCGNLYITTNEDETGPVELFTAMGKAGGCASSQAEALGRLISLAFRSGVAIENIEKQLGGIRCSNPIWKQGEMVLSCADAISKALRRYGEFRPKKDLPHIAQEPTSEGIRPHVGQRLVGTCKDCGGMVVHESGCETCQSCGYSKCS